MITSYIKFFHIYLTYYYTSEIILSRLQAAIVAIPRIIALKFFDQRFSISTNIKTANKPNRLHFDICVVMVQTPINYFFGRVPNSPHASNNLAPTSEFNSQQSINSVVTETATSYGILLILAAATVGSSPFPFSIISISLSLDSANPSPTSLPSAAN